MDKLAYVPKPATTKLVDVQPSEPTARDYLKLVPDPDVRCSRKATQATRRLLAGTFEPTLGQLVDLASVFGVAAMDLCAHRE